MNVQTLISRYRGFIAYAIFGVLTTVVNIAAYYVCARLMGLGTGTSTAVAWVLAVLFAFVTNKLWVFNSRSWARRVVARELISFYGCRIATGLLDLGYMLVTVDLWHWDDMWMKLISNIIVIILNYVASRFVIFRK